MITLDHAEELTRTGDIWLFRGSSGPDRAIQSLTNAPVNHVGMAVVLEDLPPLMWHAELGRSLPDRWTGQHQRGVQLHDLRDAVLQWGLRYGQRGWLRQLDGALAPEHEDALLQTIARLDGTPFPTTAALTARWFRGRLPELRRRPTGLETAYCAEVVAITYQAMGLLQEEHRANWYDPGSFWSGDDLDLVDGFALGREIQVALPPAGGAPQPLTSSRYSRRSAFISRRKRRTADNSPSE